MEKSTEDINLVKEPGSKRRQKIFTMRIWLSIYVCI